VSTIRVHELAKELNISSKDLIEALNKIGVEVKNHLSAVTAEDAGRVKQTLEKSNAPQNKDKNAASTKGVSTEHPDLVLPEKTAKEEGETRKKLSEEIEPPPENRKPVEDGLRSPEARPQGQRPPGEMRPQGQRPPGEMRPQGQRPPGQRPPGQRPPGEMRPQGQRPPGEMRPQGQRPPGEMRPQGQRPPGQRPPGEMRPQGQRPPGEMRPQGQRPPGEMRPQSETPGRDEAARPETTGPETPGRGEAARPETTGPETPGRGEAARPETTALGGAKTHQAETAYQRRPLRYTETSGRFERSWGTTSNE